MKPEFKERIRDEYKQYRKTMSPGAAKKRLQSLTITVGDVLGWMAIDNILYRKKKKPKRGHL